MRTASRVFAAGVGLAGLAVLVAARGLEPDPRGYGTHEQLGLSPCFFQQWTGRVCPACGTTTAWSHVLRGELPKAVEANLGGTLLCGLTLVATPWLLASAIAGRWLGGLPSLPLMFAAGAIWFAVALMDWARRLYFG